MRWRVRQTVLKRGGRKIRSRSGEISTARPRPMQECFPPGWRPPSPTAPALRLGVNASFEAPSINLKLVNGSAVDLFPVQFTLD